MRFPLIAFLTVLSLISSAQTKIEFREPIDSNSVIILTDEIEITAVEPGYQLWLPEGEEPIIGMIVFTRPRRENEPIDFFVNYATEHQLAVLYANTENRLEFFFQDSSMTKILGYIDKVCRDYSIPTDKLMYCGMSLEGTRALKLVEYASRETSEVQIRPQAVAICDAPLDMVRFYREATTARDRKIRDVAAKEGKWVSAHLEKYLGDPIEDRQNYIDYSPYCFAAYGGTHLKCYVDVALRAYTEPDVLWWMETRGKDYYGMNAIDMAGIVSELRYLGNERAELILTQDKGYYPDGTRHPHSWSIVDERELIDWFLYLSD